VVKENFDSKIALHSKQAKAKANGEHIKCLIKSYPARSNILTICQKVHEGVRLP
jgi:hypothetical protein